MSALIKVRLTPEQVLRRCVLPNTPLSSEEPLDAALFLGLGQDRFAHAMELFAETEGPQHNMYISGLSGGAGFAVVEGHLKKALSGRKLPDPQDVCYVHNFEDAHRPQPIMFPKGKGRKFQKRLVRLLAELKHSVPSTLHSRPVQQELKAAYAAYETWKEDIQNRLCDFGREKGFEVKGEFPEMRYVIVESHDPNYLSEQARAEQRRKQSDFDEALQNWFRENDIFKEHARLATEAQAQMEAVKARVAHDTVTDAFNRLFPDEGPRRFREHLLQYALNHYQIFVEEPERNQATPWSAPDNPFLPWEVRVFVDHHETEGAPIVAAGITELSEAIGSISHGKSFGFMYTVDHRNLNPGYFHVANGGYLILSARDVASVPGLWQVVKYVIKNQKLCVAQVPFSFQMHEAIRPEAIAAQLKIILFGPSWLMHLFAFADDEFSQLFRIRADVLPFVNRTDEQLNAYRAWLGEFTKAEALHSLTDEAVCALLEYGSRLVHDQERLSIDFETLGVVVREANALIDARLPESEKRIDRSHVAYALKKRLWRGSFLQDYQLERVHAGDLLIATQGEVVGQINALAVSSLRTLTDTVESFCSTAIAPFSLPPERVHGFTEGCTDAALSAAQSFGHATRITAQASVGKFAITNIQKEIDMAGPSFKKADLIVQGLLRGLYAQDALLSVHITFAFEQMYGGIDGDSASLAKFYAITSAIARIPIKQGIAITGSVNQHGEIQPIGGVNEKIEGFFDTCLAHGALTGEQGVIIPHQNARNLMLRDDVVEAVWEKKFSVWAIRTLDEGVEILTGNPAESFHLAVKLRLQDFRRMAKEDMPTSSRNTESH